MKASGTLRFVASFYFCCLLTNRSAGQRVRQCASRPRRTWPRCCQARPPSRLAPSHTHTRACPRPHSRMAHVCVKTAACATTQRLRISGITKSHITTTCVPWQAARFLEEPDCHGDALPLSTPRTPRIVASSVPTRSAWRSSSPCAR